MGDSVAMQVFMVIITKLLMDILLSHIIPYFVRIAKLRRTSKAWNGNGKIIKKLCNIEHLYDTKHAKDYFPADDMHTVFENEVKAHFGGAYTVNGEYMKVIIQFGYLVMFSCAFPLYPIILMLYNWLEIKLDIIEYTKSINRAQKEKVH